MIIRDTSPFHVPHGPDGALIGLFGGSFNPPHKGHALVAYTAIRRLGLDQLWWMVSPGNPLKDHRGLPSVEERISASHIVVDHPAIHITGFEKTIGTRTSVETIAYLLQHRPKLHFVWVMGADSLANFDHWHDWQVIAETLPVAVIDRPGVLHAALSSKFAIRYRHYRLDAHNAPLLGRMAAPAWVYLYGPRSDLSSTALRQR